MSAQVPPAPPKPRRWFRKLVLVVLLVVLALVAVAALVVARIPRLDGVGALPSPGTSPATYLLIGSDSRADLGDLEGSFGSFGGQRSDVIIMARPAAGSLHLLSLPRDLKVTIPDRGTDKINAAYAYGGPDLLARTVADNTGLPVHHIVEIDFGGFAELVDSVGGIDIDFPNAARDEKSGLEVAAGTTRIDGATALAYVRSRSYQELRDGSWVSVDADDIGRTARQQEAVRALLSRIASPSGLVRVPQLALALDEAISVDRGFNVIDLVLAGWGMRSAQIDAATLPVVFSNEGGVSYVVQSDPDANEMLGRFAQGADLVVEPIP